MQETEKIPLKTRLRVSVDPLSTGGFDPENILRILSSFFDPKAIIASFLAAAIGLGLSEWYLNRLETRNPKNKN